jgi:sterol desaturase/sphingolipid hydroxylase (fatty acid hydroxylase superfamily)
MSETQRLKIGEGYISGYISIFLGVSSLFAIVCFHFPEYFTTPEFREVYTGEMMKSLLIGVIIASFFFATLSFLLSKKKKLPVIGIVLCVISIAFGGFDVQARSVEKTVWSIGLDWLLLDLFILAIIFIPIEMAFPKRKGQPRFHEEWRTDLVYFAISHLLVQLFGVITQAPAKVMFGWLGLAPFQEWVQNLPFVIEFFLALLVTDLFQYWAHRLFHSHVYLWRFHSVHHSTHAMDWLAGSRTHFVDIFVVRSISFMPLYICGFSEITFNTYIIFVSIHAVLIHANTSINFGFFKYLFVTPQFHHWHHCEDPKIYGKNFAIHFPFLDKVFGTYYLPGNVWPDNTGVREANYPKGYFKQLVYPFTKSPFDNDLNMTERSDR